MSADISNTERLLWYRSALVTLKQSVLQVGAGEGSNPADVVRALHGYDFDPWIPPLDEDTRFADFLWDKARALAEEDDKYREALDTPMLQYWHHYEAHVRAHEFALTGGKPEPTLYAQRLLQAYITANEAKRLALKNS